METVKLKASLKNRLIKYQFVPYAKRLQLAADLNVSRPTIDNYIKGEVRNMEFAEKLLKKLDKIKTK